MSVICVYAVKALTKLQVCADVSEPWLQYSKTCLKRPFKDLETNGSLMKVECIAECSKRAFSNFFDLH